jgi:hypothetical protein
MSSEKDYKGYLIISHPNPRGDAGWGAQVAILRVDPAPLEFKGYVFLDETYATQNLARDAGIKAAERRIDLDDLP